MIIALVYLQYPVPLRYQVVALFLEGVSLYLLKAIISFHSSCQC